MPGVPTLLQLCISAAASSSAWRKQRRVLERLPEHAANALLALLLARKAVAAPQLELFRHSVTVVHLSGAAATGEALAYIAEFWHLEELHITRATKLRDADLLAVLPGTLPTCLRTLALIGCRLVTTRSCAALQALTLLQSLDISDTGMRSPVIIHITALSALTHLDMGGTAVSDADCELMAGSMPKLRQLIAWGSQLSVHGLRSLAALPNLAVLNVAWSHLDILPALPQVQVLRLDKCTLRDVWWPTLGDTCGESATRTASAAPPADTPAHGLLELHLVDADLTMALLPVQQAIGTWSATLQVLDLSGTAVAGCDFLNNATTLTRLNLSRTAVVDDALWHIAAAAPGLQELSLSGTRVGTAGVAALRVLTDLRAPPGLQAAGCRLPVTEALDLSSTCVNDSSLSWLQQLTALQHLDLSNCGVSGVLPSQPHPGDGAGRAGVVPGTVEAAAPAAESGGGHAWGAMAQLRRLNLLHTKYTDLGLQQLRVLAGRPLHLKVGSHLVTDEGLQALAGMDGLTTLALQGCAITEHGVRRLGKLASLRRVDVSACWLVTTSALQDLLLEGRGTLHKATLDGVEVGMGMQGQAVEGGSALVNSKQARAAVALSVGDTRQGRPHNGPHPFDVKQYDAALLLALRSSHLVKHSTHLIDLPAVLRRDY